MPLTLFFFDTRLWFKIYTILLNSFILFVSTIFKTIMSFSHIIVYRFNQLFWVANIYIYDLKLRARLVWVYEYESMTLKFINVVWLVIVPITMDWNFLIYYVCGWFHYTIHYHFTLYQHSYPLWFMETNQTHPKKLLQ